jgi:hypothetical protein
MKNIYGYYADRWGESEHMIWFDPARATPASRLPRLHVAVWPADDDCDVTTLVTLGVSDLELDRCDRNRIEFHWAVRGHLGKDEIQLAATFLANLAEYPFDHGRCLDWWHRLNHPGSIPFFPDATALLLRPPFSDGEQGDLCFDGEHIRTLYVVPLNATEAKVLSQDGIDAYQHYVECNQLDPLGTRLATG